MLQIETLEVNGMISLVGCQWRLDAEIQIVASGRFNNV